MPTYEEGGGGEVTGVQTCALPISCAAKQRKSQTERRQQSHCGEPAAPGSLAKRLGKIRRRPAVARGVVQRRTDEATRPDAGRTAQTQPGPRSGPVAGAACRERERAEGCPRRDERGGGCQTADHPGRRVAAGQFLFVLYGNR